LGDRRDGQYRANSSVWRAAFRSRARPRIGDLSRGTALALFRIVQETLRNAAKHAAAKRIVVRLNRSDSLVSLTVTDDARGFD
jgi:signal transduction histidine kinase